MEKQNSKCSIGNDTAKRLSKISHMDTKMDFEVFNIPLASLNKNELDPMMHINNYEAPQFDGLDKHIWPFMIEWYKNDKQTIFSECLPRDTRSCLPSKCTKNIKHQQLQRITKEKPLNKKIKEPIVTIEETTKSKKCDIYNESQQQNKSHKSINQFKDKTLKFLYKKQSSQGTICYREIGVQVGVNHINYGPLKKAEKCTDTFNVINKTVQNMAINKALKCSNRTRQVTNRLWSKTKRVNNFIDCIINKLTNGVYYVYQDKTEADSELALSNILLLSKIISLYLKEEINIISDFFFRIQRSINTINTDYKK